MSQPKTPWMENVVTIPRHSLSITEECESPLHIVNNNSERLAFKLKTTRSNSLKPKVTCGVLEPNGGCVHIKVAFQPSSKEKRLNENDRLTIVMKPAPAGTVNWEACLLETKNDPCGRIVMRLKRASSPEVIGTIDDSEDSTADT